MKITITEYDTTVSVESLNGSDIWEVHELIKGLLVAVGYHPTTVDETFTSSDRPEERWFPEESETSMRDVVDVD